MSVVCAEVAEVCLASWLANLKETALHCFLLKVLSCGHSAMTLFWVSKYEVPKGFLQKKYIYAFLLNTTFPSVLEKRADTMGGMH